MSAVAVEHRERRNPLAAVWAFVKHHVLTALDRSLDRSVPDRDAKAGVGGSMWW